MNGPDDAPLLVGDVRAALRSAADPTRAAGQQAYMKSARPFLGVRVPDARRVTRAALPPGVDDALLLTVARTLWDEATHREEWYAALAVLGRVRPDPAIVPFVEHCVRTGQWWDVTDELAHRVADLHDTHPAATAALVRRWSVDEDFWLRRLAILSQLGRRDRVQETLLAAVIEPNRADREFFVRKAIGWALRDHARVAPEWVRRYVDTHELSPLSRREALKHLGPS